MELIEIVLLVIGVAVVVASFWIPEQKQEQDSGTAMTKEQIKEMFDDEYTDIKVRISQLTDETVSYSVEKAERVLERITNEKMLTFGEYADSSMAQISANHEETVFMYDMLNKSKQDLTELLLLTDKNAQDALVSAQDALKACEGAKIYANEAMDLAESAKAEAADAKKKADAVGKSVLLARKIAQSEIRANSQNVNNVNVGNANVSNTNVSNAYSGNANVNNVNANNVNTNNVNREEMPVPSPEPIQNNVINTESVEFNHKNNSFAETVPAPQTVPVEPTVPVMPAEQVQPTVPVQPNTPVEYTVPVEQEIPVTPSPAQIPAKEPAPKADAQLSFADELLQDETEVSINFTPDEGNRTNSNARILELHRRGKSNMAIAKELGLGIGEVKLVIDLFERK